MNLALAVIQVQEAILTPQPQKPHSATQELLDLRGLNSF